MEKLKIISNSEEETLKIGIKLGSLLKIGNTVVLTGDLGSGKTKLTEGILTYYKLEDEISSPTFTIVNEYIKDNIKIFHFDVYRLEDSSEFYAIGGDEYFEKGICIIEWGELIQDALPQEYLHIKFERDNNNENSRIINIISYGNKYDSLLNNFK